MEGTRQSVTSADGVRIGRADCWVRARPAARRHGRYRELAACRGCADQAAARDRRGPARPWLEDADNYELSSEYGDVAAGAAALAGEQGGPVGVVGHSIGATCLPSLSSLTSSAWPAAGRRRLAMRRAV